MDFSVKDIERLIKAAHGRVNYMKIGALELDFRDKEQRKSRAKTPDLSQEEIEKVKLEESERIRREELETMQVTNPYEYEKLMEREAAASS